MFGVFGVFGLLFIFVLFRFFARGFGVFGLFDFTNLTKFKFFLNSGCRVNGFITTFSFELRLYKVLILVILVLLFFVFIQFRSDFSVKYLLYPRFKALLPTLKL